MRSSQLVLALAAFLPVTLGHVALWDEGMYGWDPNDPNQNGPVNPLMNLTEAEWWFHGYIDILPPTGAYMTLPAGGTYHGEVACNKALTSYGDNPPQQTGLYACDTIGPLHTADAWASPNPIDVKGCGIAIAYQSDVSLIKPEDFAVISVNYTCPWSKDVDFQIPSDLPPSLRVAAIVCGDGFTARIREASRCISWGIGVTSRERPERKRSQLPTLPISVTTPLIRPTARSGRNSRTTGSRLRGITTHKALTTHLSITAPTGS